MVFFKSLALFVYIFLYATAFNSHNSYKTITESHKIITPYDPYDCTVNLVRVGTQKEPVNYLVYFNRLLFMWTIFSEIPHKPPPIAYRSKCVVNIIHIPENTLNSSIQNYQIRKANQYVIENNILSGRSAVYFAVIFIIPRLRLPNKIMYQSVASTYYYSSPVYFHYEKYWNFSFPSHVFLANFTMKYPVALNKFSNDHGILKDLCINLYFRSRFPRPNVYWKDPVFSNEKKRISWSEREGTSVNYGLIEPSMISHVRVCVCV